MSTSAAPARVPAWKRLGLKLKYAKDAPPDTENIQPPVGHTAKGAPSPNPEKLNIPQKRPFEDTSPPTPAKRSKASEKPAIYSKPSGGKRSAFEDYQRSRAQAPQRHIGSLGPSGTLQAAGVAPKKVVFDDDDDPLPIPSPVAQIATPVQEPARPPSPRKSVSFTPDTKGQDGFSSQKFSKGWASGEHPAEGPTVPAAVEEEPKKENKKKVKKSKSTLISKVDTAKDGTAKDDTTFKANTEEADGTVNPREASAQTPPYVEYLQQHYQDRESWKFSKKHQNNLVKNLFNIYHIPPEHNPAIVQYISGLKGSARFRVAKQAVEVLKKIWQKQRGEEEMPVDTPAARRVAYYQALHRHIERYAASGAGENQYIDDQLAEIRREVDQGKRSEQILEHLEGELEKVLDEALEKESSSETAVTPSKTKASTSEPIAAEPPVPREPSKAPSPEKSEKKKRNKRKARTQVSEDEEESSLESSAGNESE